VALLPATGRKPQCGSTGCESGKELLREPETTATPDAGEGNRQHERDKSIATPISPRGGGTAREMRQETGLSTEEIAQQTGIPKASVQSMIAMARKKLFNEMKRRMNL